MHIHTHIQKRLQEIGNMQDGWDEEGEVIAPSKMSLFKKIEEFILLYIPISLEGKTFIGPYIDPCVDESFDFYWTGSNKKGRVVNILINLKIQGSSCYAGYYGEINTIGQEQNIYKGSCAAFVKNNDIASMLSLCYP